MSSDIYTNYDQAIKAETEIADLAGYNSLDEMRADPHEWCAMIPGPAAEKVTGLAKIGSEIEIERRCMAIARDAGLNFYKRQLANGEISYALEKPGDPGLSVFTTVQATMDHLSELQGEETEAMSQCSPG